MESADRERVIKMLERDMRLRRLYDEHVKLEEKLSRFENRGFLTSPEAKEQTELKKRKLRGVDKMMAIVGQVSEAA